MKEEEKSMKAYVFSWGLKLGKEDWVLDLSSY